MNADIMLADRRRTVVESGSGALEVIVPDADAAVRWASHEYPNSLAKWHHHPQIEFHLIREGSGLMMAGDCVVPFRAGHVALIGSNLPRNWVSDVKPGERLARRDVLCHVRPQTMKALMACFPETARFNLVLRRAARMLGGYRLEIPSVFGESAQAAGALLEGMGDHDPARRVADLIELFGVFADAPETEASTVVTPGYDLELNSDTERTVNEAIAYVTENLAGEISLEEAARLVSMSPSAFSRFFKRAAGIGFSDFVRRLRIGRAKRMLATTDRAVARIREECGYDNASNFTKIYCSCGRIVNIDRKSCSVKRKLHKTIECAVCRNLRIGRELDLLDEHYSVPEQSVYD